MKKQWWQGFYMMTCIVWGVIVVFGKFEAIDVPFLVKDII